MPPIHHVSIGFLPEGFHPLHRFVSLSNRPECPTSKLDRVLKASAILWHSVSRQDRQFRFRPLIGSYEEAAGRDDDGTALPPRNWGRGLAAPPELRTHNCSRINLAKTAELEALGGAG
jgi:hypothetical protein